MKALAERYAGALVDVALENKQADQVKLELAAFAAMIRESSDLHAFLSNPSIAAARSVSNVSDMPRFTSRSLCTVALSSIPRAMVTKA